MNSTTSHARWLSIAAVAAATLFTGCAEDASLGPDRPSARPAQRTLFAPPDLGSCDSLRAPTGNEVAYHTYATGVQIYRWTGTSWAFIAPSATLYADAEGKATVGTHYAGPTWESLSGSKVVGAAIKRCTPDANAIPWLLLQATSSEGRGIFKGVTFIQRVNTVGGKAPTDSGDVINEERRVPYTTEYFFYRPEE